MYHTRVERKRKHWSTRNDPVQTTNGKGGRARKKENGDHSFCRHNQPHASRKGMKIWSRVREIWANPYRVYGLGTTRIREEKPGNWKFARVKCPRKQRDSWLGVSLVGFYPNNNQILDFYCAYWSLFPPIFELKIILEGPSIAPFGLERRCMGACCRTLNAKLRHVILI